MMRGTFFKRGAVFIVGLTVVAVFALQVGVQGIQSSVDPAGPSRADRIDIDSLKVFGTLERPIVPFFHDRHTEALARQNKDCQVCHLKDQNRQSLKFMRLKDESKAAVMDIYHGQCISCHKETRAEGLKSGPVTCGNCHQGDLQIASSWQPIGMDKSLHYRHVKSMNNKCDACHHEYDAAQKKLVYTKGKEGTCRYCHGQTTQENRIAFRLASHQACIDCHRQKTAADTLAGPVDCGGCHDAQEQQMIEMVKDVPRMERNQPNVVLVRKLASSQAGKNESANPAVTRVPFNHKAHEQYNDTCRACHHADLNACASCHTQQGAKEGDQIKLSQAMHQAGAQQSCVGCHSSFQQKPQCAGCHVSINTGPQLNEDTCGVCHQTLPTDSGNPETAEEMRAVAERLLASRSRVTGTYQPKDVPETVDIGVLSKEYQPVRLPHRKIIDALVRNVKDDTLAGYFHTNEATLCQGCHHRSPASTKPPKCGSCHGRPFDAAHPKRPGLMAAYHQQCMDCHNAMGLLKPVETDCEGCHKKK